MKNLLPASIFAAFALSLFASFGVGNALAADQKTSPAGAVTTVQMPVRGPSSVFTIAGPIKDPFFPLSTRTNFVPVTTNTVAPSFSPTTLVLKGLSGVAGQRLALINNRNFAEGESDEVTTSAGKKKVTVLKINEFSVLIRVDGIPEPFEISLPKSFR